VKVGRTFNSRSLPALLILVLVCPWPAVGDASEPRAFILDVGSNSVIVLDTGKVEILGTVSFASTNLKSMIQVPHSRRLAVFDQGPGKDTLRFGWHPEGKASVSFVDMDTMKVTSNQELGWGIGQVLATSDGKRLAIVCPGYTSQKPEEALPGEVVVVNTETYQITGRFPVKVPVDLLLTPDNRTLITFTSFWRYKDRARTPEVQFAKMETATVVGTVTPSKGVTSAELSTDGQYLYLLDPGEPSDKVEDNVNGFLAVLSVSKRSELAAIDVGSAPQNLIHDSASDYLLILSDAPPVKERRETGGFLRVFKGTELVTETPVAYSPLLLTASPDGAVLYVVGPDTISTVNPSTFKAIDEIHIQGTKGRSYQRGGKNELDEFAITPDGKRGIALFSNSDSLTVVNLDEKKSIASLKTGRGSKRFMKRLITSLKNYNATQSAQDTANETGVTQYYTVETLKPANVSVAVSQDSRFAYALNNQTKDVTVMDVQAGKVLSKLPTAEGLLIQTMPGGNAIALPGLLSVTFIDTTANQKMRFGDDDRLKVGGLGGLLQAFQVSPSGNRACALVTKRIICIDTSAMKEVGRQEHFKDLEMMLFEKH
jgi:DNA-binding beta-propeller fold protein YncE